MIQDVMRIVYVVYLYDSNVKGTCTAKTLNNNNNNNNNNDDNDKKT